MGVPDTSVARPAPVEAGRADVLLLVDLFNDFRHEDGDALAASFLDRLPALERLVGAARGAGLPLVYVNDCGPDGGCRRDEIVAAALDGRIGPGLAGVVPRPEDTFIVKPFYSAFEETELDARLRRLEARVLAIAGAATERCVTQTVTSARERELACLLAADACATVSLELESVALDYLERVAEATIVSTGDLVAALARPGRVLA